MLQRAQAKIARILPRLRIILHCSIKPRVFAAGMVRSTLEALQAGDFSIFFMQILAIN